MQSEEVNTKPDFDLYVPTWLMITLVVECSIVGYFNQSISAYFSPKVDDVEIYVIGHISSTFFFMLIFFLAAPLAIYLFARVKLLDGGTKFLKLYSALGYSYASYVPAILITLLGVDYIKWLAIILALVN